MNLVEWLGLGAFCLLGLLVLYSRDESKVSNDSKGKSKKKRKKSKSGNVGGSGETVPTVVEKETASSNGRKGSGPKDAGSNIKGSRKASSTLESLREERRKELAESMPDYVNRENERMEEENRLEERLAATVKSKTFELKNKGGAQATGLCPYGIGDRVEARYQKGDNWFPGTVTKVASGALMTIKYDDGESEFKVHASLVRPFGANSAGGGDNNDEDESDSDDSTNFESTYNGHALPNANPNATNGGWTVAAPKPKKTREERVEARTERAVTDKNRKKREKKRAKELLVRQIAQNS